MRAKPVGKYELKDLYEEIDLFDRKISYCQTLEAFASEQGRAAALQKLVTRRKSLVKVAVAAVKDGVECDAKYLPRSFKHEGSSEEPAS